MILKNIHKGVLAFFAVMGLSTLVALPVYAVGDPLTAACQAAQQSENVVCKNSSDNGKQKLNDSIKSIVNLLLYILGIVSVIVIIVAGIMFSTSAGDAGNVTKAKDAILYAVIGLVVASLAYAIVNFVVKNI